MKVSIEGSSLEEDIKCLLPQIRILADRAWMMSTKDCIKILEVLLERQQERE